MVRQSTGQMSMQASHSMHSFAANTVCTSQLRQRCTSCAACSAVKPSSTSMLSLLEALDQRDMRHQAALHRRCSRSCTTTRACPSCGSERFTPRAQAVGDRLALAVAVDGDGGLVAVLHGPDDVLRARRRRRRRRTPRRRVDWKVDLVDHRHVPLVELDAEVALDPREGVLLADGEDHVVARKEFLVDHALAVISPPSSVVFQLARTACPSACRPRSRSDLGAWLTTISTLSSSASSSSQAEALKNAARLARHDLHVLARRAAAMVRQQSMAVLPTPMMSTRSPILSMWPKATDSSQAMPM